MHKGKFWAGVILILVALLPAIGITIVPALAFTGPLLVVIAAAGGFLIVGGSGMSKGWKLWTAVILLAIAFLPTFGFVLIPALVFTGPLLVIVAALGGYLLAKPSHGHPF